MKIKTPKREVKSFRNKYLALTIISLLFFATSQAQWIKPNNSYGTISNGQSIERVLFFPTGCGTPNKLNIPDSAVNKFAIYGDSCGNVAYLYNPRTKIWSPISNGSGIIQDGLISGGIVTWSGSGLKFYITPAVYVIGGKFYNSPFDSVTLATAPTSDSRIDLIGVDTTGHAFATTGTASATPIVPQADITSQIALTTGILLNAGDTVPSNVTTDIVYSEGVKPPDWDTLTQGTPMVVNFSNTTNPHAGSKDVYVSRYSQGSTLKFVSPSLYPVTTDATLSFWIYLNGKFTNQVYAQLYDASASASAWLRITPYFNINDSAKYQLVTVPVSSFAWTKYSGNFDRVLFNLTGYDTSGTKGFYLDNIQFQKGINSIPPPTDYSNKLDSVLLSGDTLWQYSKGVKTFKGLASGSGTGNNNPDSLNNHAGSEYLLAADTTDKWIPTGTIFPINVIEPIKAIDSTTIGIDSLSLVDTLLKAVFDAKQNLLVSGTNIKTINGTSVLGSGDLTISSGGGGTDSASVHVGHITAVGDTAIVFTDLRGNSDTISLRFLQYWKKNGNNIYYSGGNVGINVDTPAYNLHIRQATVLTDDNSGLYMQNTDASSGAKISPPITLGAVNNNAGTISYRGFVIRTETPGSSSLSTLKIYPRTNYVTSAFPIFSLGDNGALTLPGIINQTAGGTNVFNGSISSAGQLTSTNSSANSQTRYGFRNTASTITASGTIYGFAQDGTYSPGWGAVLIPFSNLNGNNLFNQNSGSTGIGVTTVNNSAKLELADTTKGFLLTRMTKAQRDKIISSITGSITNGGTGYATTSGSAVALTGGSGTGAYGLFVVSGGVVTSMTITIIGTGYKAGDVLSFTGVGTGFTYTISAVGGPAEGLQIYQTDNTPGPRYYIGGTWYKTTLTAD